MQKKISVELSPELHAQVKAALYGGIGAVNAYIDENGHLIIELKTGQTFDCGMAVGPKGDTGPQGERGPQGEKGEKGDTGPQGAPGIISELQDEDGTAMPPEPILQFVGFQVNDDPSGKTIVSPKTAGGTQNVAGYVGEISLFADNQLRENHVWADGSTINPATWPDLAAYAATAGWETDSGTGWYKTPNLQGCFLLPSSAEHAVNTTGGEKEHTLTVQEMPAHTHTTSIAYRTMYMSNDEGVARKSGDLITEGGSGEKSYTTASTGGGQPHNNMPPYYVVTAQIRAKVDIIEATAVEVNGNTLGGFEDGQVLAQQGGKIVGKEITAASLGAVQPYQAGDTITLNYSAMVAYVTGGGTDLNFQIPLDRPVNARAAAFSGQINVRMSTGQYALNNITIQSTDSAIGPSGIKFTLKPSWNNAPTNNVVLVVQIYNGATITLS